VRNGIFNYFNDVDFIFDFFGFIMIRINASFVCDKCGKVLVKKLLLREQKNHTLDHHMPAGWLFVSIGDVRFLVCDICVIGIVTSLLNPEHYSLE